MKSGPDTKGPHNGRMATIRHRRKKQARLTKKAQRRRRK